MLFVPAQKKGWKNYNVIKFLVSFCGVCLILCSRWTLKYDNVSIKMNIIKI
jgi:hypothetical protein